MFIIHSLIIKLNFNKEWLLYMSRISRNPRVLGAPRVPRIPKIQMVNYFLWGPNC
jgi:hypothetical protein